MTPFRTPLRHRRRAARGPRGGGLRSIAPLLLAAAGAATAGPADVTRAHAQCSADSVCRFTVSVKHADGGWKHYADRWEVLGPEGEILATRTLRHPHLHEQPFTRKLPGVEIPATLETVRIRAHDSLHGFAGAEVDISLER